jgi:glycosyltransferase involved in cell wall biosynthesis
MVAAQDVTVIIITKNRTQALRRLLGSLDQLEVKPGEVIIVSSSNNLEEERLLVDAFPSLLIRHIYEPKHGYSVARNTGIKAAHGLIVAFVDDDCTVPRNWIGRIVLAQNRVGKWGVVMGAVTSLPRDNFWSQVAQMHYDNWVKTICHEGYCSTLDAKVTSFDRDIFIKKGHWFEKSLGAGSEDIEFGYRIAMSGLKILYDPTVYFYHYERIIWKDVLQQRWRIATSEVVVARYVKNYELVDMLPPVKLQKLIPRALRKLRYWFKVSKPLWSLRYVFILPVFFVVRMGGYFWGNLTWLKNQKYV